MNDYPGISIKGITSAHELTQVINEPTNFEPNKTPSSIDLLFFSQPGLLMESGTLASLRWQCHHNMIYAKIDLTRKSPKPFRRKVWIYKDADEREIRKCLSSITWERNILHKNANDQGNFVTESILNFCPSRMITQRFKDKPWMTDTIKTEIESKV